MKQPQRELIVSYQFRETNRVLKLQRDATLHSHSEHMNSHHQNHNGGGVSRRVNSILLSATSPTTHELTIARARLIQSDFNAMVRFLSSEQQQRRHPRPIQSIVFQSCLLERIDAIVPLLQFWSKETCHLESICFTGVEVLMEQDDEKKDENEEDGNKYVVASAAATSHVYHRSPQHATTSSTPTIAPPHYSCMVRPLLQQFPFACRSGSIAVHKLTLQNVDLCGQEDGRLLAEFFAKNPQTRSLEMYQSVLGPHGSHQLCQAMIQSPTTAAAGTAESSYLNASTGDIGQHQGPHHHNNNDEGELQELPHDPVAVGGGMIQDLFLRYCSLDELTGVPELVRQVAHPSSTSVRLGLHRNRSPPSVILPLLSHALTHSTSLQHLILSDSPSLFMLNYDDSTRTLSSSSLRHSYLRGENAAATSHYQQLVKQNFIQALQSNRTLVSLQIDSCGIPSTLMGPLIQALESKASTLTHVSLSSSRMSESALRQLNQTLPLLENLQSLHLKSSAVDGVMGVLSTAALRELTHQVLQRQTSLIDFVGSSGWLDPFHAKLLQNITSRNIWLQKARALLQLSSSSLSSSGLMDDNNALWSTKTTTRTTTTIGPVPQIPLGLWPDVLARMLQTPERGDDESHDVPRYISSTGPGLSAGLTILQSMNQFAPPADPPPVKS